MERSILGACRSMFCCQRWDPTMMESRCPHYRVRQHRNMLHGTLVDIDVDADVQHQGTRCHGQLQRTRRGRQVLKNEDAEDKCRRMKDAEDECPRTGLVEECIFWVRTEDECSSTYSYSLSHRWDFKLPS